MDQKKVDELISSIAYGDMGAWEALYYQMYNEIYGYLLSLIRNKDDAEDMVQDTFMRVYRYAPNFIAQGKGKSWVYKIAGHLALTYLKKSKNTSSISDELRSDANTEECAVNYHSVMSAIDKLPETERQIVTLHAISGFTLSEIAEVIELPLGTVKWKHAKALKSLRKILGEDFI